ncbi:MAG: hypothetical protein Q8N14_01425 [Candidatus Omnitrophota bacterium]|nr:hypothetical protein [Candidatus Omnitrophota bacterium]
MKAFLVGLLFLVAVLVLSSLGVLLYPLFLVMAVLLRIVIGLSLLLFAIWLLGRFIIWVWESLRGR